MAHCQDCGCNKLSCGCKDTYLTTPPPCPIPEDCPDAQPCSEVFDAQCIIYTGADITCGQDLVVTQNDSIATALSSIVNYFCTADNGLVLENDLYCPESPVIAPAGTPVNEALELLTQYICTGLPITAVVAGPGISVTENTVGNVTTYTVTNTVAAPTTYGLYAQTANSTTVIDPIPGSLIGAGVGTLSVPANTFAVGDSFRAKLGGHITCSNTQELTITVYANGDVIGTTNLIDLKTTTNKHWNLEIDFTIRSLGVTGSVVSLGQFSYIPNPSGQAFEGSDFSVVSTLDTTVLNTLDIVASWNVNEGGVNSIYSEYFTLTKIY